MMSAVEVRSSTPTLGDEEDEAMELDPLNTSVSSGCLNRSAMSYMLRDASENCCILVVGSTGTGKSATIAKLTGQVVASNDGVSSVTKKCAIYRPARNNANSVFPDARNLFFVDTVGWDDPEANDDE